MARIETWFDQDINELVKPRRLPGILSKGDASANLIGVRTFNNGAAEAISGTASATITKPDGSTVTQSGTVSENTAYVVLPSSAYAMSGDIKVVLKVTSGSVVTTLLAVTMSVFP